MALRVSGVSLVVKGFTSFINNLRAGQVATSKFDKTLANLQLRVRSLEKAYESSQKRISIANQNIAKAQSNIAIATKNRENAELRLQDLQNKGKASLEQLQIAQNNLTNAIIREAIAALNLTNAQLGLNIAETKGEDTADKLSVAQQSLADYMAKASAVMDDFQNSLIQSIPHGRQLAGILSSLGLSGGALTGVLAAVAAAFITVRTAIWAVQKAFDALKWAVDTVIKVAKGIAGVFVKAFQTVYNVVMWATRPLRTFLQHIIEIASGIALWRFIRNVGAAIRGLANEVYEAVSAFQLLEIRLQALSARDYARAFGTSMQEAMQATSGAAKELFEWMRVLAVQTIFDTEEIANAFTMAVAMGMNVNTAQDLTDALVDYVSAMGLTDEHMWRMIYNLGQMIQRGRLTGEELRDLARNIFPLLEIFDRLGAKAGMTGEQLKTLALEGGVPVNDFILEFIELVREQYPGAAERAARTIMGVTANIRDFIKTFIGMDVFKPVFDKIAGSLDDMLDSIIANQEVMKTFRMFGQLLLRVFDLLTPAVDALVESLGALWRSFAGGENVANQTKAALEGITSWGRSLAVSFAAAAILIRNKIQSIADRIKEFARDNETTFQTIIRKVGEWGYKFIGNFAKGIAGGLKLLTSVIHTIATILTTWFKPKSPPLIAPDIDKWGAETMELWIKGFTKADFSVFGDVTKLLESYFRSIADQFTKETLVPAILEMRSAIAAALASFSRGASIEVAVKIAMSGISNLGAINQEFQLYLSTLLQIQRAEEWVARAHEAVVQAQADLERARAALEAFEASLTDIAAAELEVEAASQRIKNIREQINAVTERYDRILSDLRAQLVQVTDEYDETVRLREIEEALANQRLTDEERERLMMEKRAIEIRQQIRAVEQQRDSEVDALEQQLSAAEAAKKEAEARLEMLKAQAEAQRQLLQLEIEAAEQRLKDAQFVEEQARLDLARLEDRADLYRKQIELIIEQNELFNEQKRALESVAESAEEAAEELTELANIAPPPEVESAFADLDSILDDIMKDAELAAAALTTAWSDFAAAWEGADVTGAWTGLKDAIKDFNDTVNRIFFGGGEAGGGKESVLDKIVRIWDTFKTKILKIPEDESVFDWLSENLDENQGKISKFAGVIERAAKTLYGAAELFFKAMILIGSVTNWLLEQAGIKNIARMSFDISASCIRIADGFLRIWEVIRPIMEFKSEGITLPKWISTVADAFGVLSKVKWAAINPMFGVIWSIGNALRYMADAVQYLADKLESLTEADIASFVRTIVRTMEATMRGGREHGGPVRKDKPYIVGEKRPELFVPNQSGYILPEVPSWFMNAPQVAAPMAWAGGGDVDNSVNLEITANYKNVQSEASIKYDVLAALAAIGR